MFCAGLYHRVHDGQRQSAGGAQAVRINMGAVKLKAGSVSKVNKSDDALVRLSCFCQSVEFIRGVYLLK